MSWSFSQAQLDELDRLLVPQGVDSEDNSALVQLAVSLSINAAAGKPNSRHSSTKDVEDEGKPAVAKQGLYSVFLPMLMQMQNLFTNSTALRVVVALLRDSITSKAPSDYGSVVVFAQLCFEKIAEDISCRPQLEYALQGLACLVHLFDIEESDIDEALLSRRILFLQKVGIANLMSYCFQALRKCLPCSRADILIRACLSFRADKPNYNLKHPKDPSNSILQCDDALVPGIPLLAAHSSCSSQQIHSEIAHLAIRLVSIIQSAQQASYYNEISGSQWTSIICVFSLCFPQHKNISVPLLPSKLTSLPNFVFELVLDEFVDGLGREDFAYQISLLRSLKKEVDDNELSFALFISRHPKYACHLVIAFVDGLYNSDALLLSLISVAVSGNSRESRNLGSIFELCMESSTLSRLFEVLVWSPETKARISAASLVHWLWKNAQNNQSYTNLLLHKLGSLLLLIHSNGERCQEFGLMWAELMGEAFASSELRPTVKKQILDFITIFRRQSSALSNHPSAPLYHDLSKLLKLKALPGFPQATSKRSSGGRTFHGYYLDKQVCTLCSSSLAPFERTSINYISSETRWTHDSMMSRLLTMHEIDSVIVRMDHVVSERCIRTIRVFVNCTNLSDMTSHSPSSITSLRPDQWKLVGTAIADRQADSVHINLSARTRADHIRVQFVDFYSSENGESAELLCPRCHFSVTSFHGICSRCNENAFQCRECRNINYDHLDAFLCNECGFSRFATISLVVIGRLSFVVPPIQTEEQRNCAMKELARRNSKLQVELDHVERLRDDIEESIRMSSQLGESGKSVESSKEALLSRRYHEAARCRRSISEHYQAANVLRHKLLLYAGQEKCSHIMESRSITSCAESSAVPCYMQEGRSLMASSCFVCCSFSVSLCQQIVARLCSFSNPLICEFVVSDGIVADLLSAAVWNSANEHRVDAQKKLCEIAEVSWTGRNQLHRLFRSRLLHLLDNVGNFHSCAGLAALGQLLIQLHKSAGILHLPLIIRVLFDCTQRDHDSTMLAHNFITPCLILLKRHLQNSCQSAYIDNLLRISFSGKHRQIRRFLAGFRRPFACLVTLEPLGNYAILRRLLTHPMSPHVRRYTANILHRCLVTRSTDENSDAERRIRIVSSVLRVVAGNGDDVCTSEAWALLAQIASSDVYAPLLQTKLVASMLINRLSRNTKALSRLGAHNTVTPYVLLDVVKILHKLVKISGSIRDLFKSQGWALVDAYLSLQSFIRQRCKPIEDAADTIHAIIDHVFSENIGDRRTLIRAYVSALASINIHTEGVRQTINILKQLERVFVPQKSRSSCCSMILRKDPTQEEYIRGSMRRQPYSSEEFGSANACMKHIQRRICQDLGLDDATDMFELLVRGQIINSDLPIIGVYEQIWLQGSKESNREDDGFSDYESDEDESMSKVMLVTYRLRGLNGEATENVVTSLPSDQVSKVPVQSINDQDNFAVLEVMSECEGIKTFLHLLTSLQHLELDSTVHCAMLLLKILRYSCYVPINCDNLYCQDPSPIVDLLASVVFMLDTSRKVLSTRLIELAQCVCHLLQHMSPASSHLSRLLEIFEVCSSKNPAHETLCIDLVRVFPHTIATNVDAANTVHQFVTKVDFESLDEHSSLSLSSLQYLVHLSSVIGTIYAPTVETWREAAFSLIVPFCMNYLETQYPQSVAIDDSEKLDRSILDRRSLGPVLQCLTGLYQNFRGEVVISPQMISWLHRLEGVSSANEIGPLTENFLEAIALADSRMAEMIRHLRCETRKARKNSALAKRKKMLQLLGFKATSGSTCKVVSKKTIDGLDTIEEEGSWMRCLVCHEGPELRPMAMLGIYVFGQAVDDHIGGRGLTTVSHFNLIHYSCHTDAARADRLLRPPKPEWEGATLRNSHTLCNNLLPILDANTPVQDYSDAIERYWRLAPSSSRFSRFTLLLQDVRMLLLRLATNSSFSSVSRGGGRESNMRLLPFMMQMGAFLLDSCSPDLQTRYRTALDGFVAKGNMSIDRLNQLVDAFIENSVDSGVHADQKYFENATSASYQEAKFPAKQEKLQFSCRIEACETMLLIALFVLGPRRFAAARIHLLAAFLLQVPFRRRDSTLDCRPFKRIRVEHTPDDFGIEFKSAVIYFWLVDQLHGMISGLESLHADQSCSVNMQTDDDFINPASARMQVVLQRCHHQVLARVDHLCCQLTQQVNSHNSSASLYDFVDGYEFGNHIRNLIQTQTMHQNAN